MSDPVPTAAVSALAELMEVSPQVDAAVILERDGGRLLASAPIGNDRMSDRFGATCVKILDAAEQARTELGREPVSQVEVATPDGHVFVVADGSWIVAAVTDADPTVGLVFYDLKTALRSVREARAARSTSSGSQPKIVTMSDSNGSSTDDDDETSRGDDDVASGGSRWRRRKQ